MKIYDFPKVDKPLIGSNDSKKFWEIFNGITFSVNNDARHRNMKNFRPSLDSNEHYTIILLDDKPGLYYYDGNVFIFTYSYVIYDDNPRDKEVGIYIDAIQRRKTDNSFSTVVVFDRDLCDMMNPTPATCKAVSAFARNALAGIKNHVQNSKTIREYITSFHKKSKHFSDWWTA